MRTRRTKRREVLVQVDGLNEADASDQDNRKHGCPSSQQRSVELGRQPHPEKLVEYYT